MPNEWFNDALLSVYLRSFATTCAIELPLAVLCFSRFTTFGRIQTLGTALLSQLLTHPLLILIIPVAIVRMADPPGVLVALEALWIREILIAAIEGLFYWRVLKIAQPAIAFGLAAAINLASWILGEELIAAFV